MNEETPELIDVPPMGGTAIVRPTRSQMRHQRHRESLERTDRLLSQALLLVKGLQRLMSDSPRPYTLEEHKDLHGYCEQWIGDYGKYKDEQQKAKVLSLQWQSRSDNRSNR